MILSICIPSYNRFGELKKLLDSIAESKSDKFNVFIVDNGSEGDVHEIGKYDKRFTFIKRETTLPGPVSVRASIDYGDGQFVMLCLDKDFVLGIHLESFIEKLEENRGIACGYCELNSTNSDGIIRINNSGIDKKIYRCGHPSGYFFRRDVLEEATRKMDPYDKESFFYNNPFLLDLAYAYGLIEGKEGIYTGKLIFPETLEKASLEKSHTYTAKNKNVFFVPERRRTQMFLMFKHLDGLKLSICEKKRIVKRLFGKTMFECTIGYKQFMSNEKICIHYAMVRKKITVKQMIAEAWALSTEFKEFRVGYCSWFFKLKLVIYSWIVLLAKILIRKQVGRISK